MQVIYTRPNRHIKDEINQSIPAFVPFEAGTVWFVRMSRADRKLMTVDEYEALVRRMDEPQLLQACRNRKLPEDGSQNELRKRLLHGISRREPGPKTVEPKTVEPPTFRDLQELCKDHGLSAAGKRDELEVRLNAAGLLSPDTAIGPDKGDGNQDEVQDAS